MASALGFVSVEELAQEISKHHESDLLRSQLAELRAKKIDLKKFCSNVRMMVGAQVLLDTVRGLQAKQRAKLPQTLPLPLSGEGSAGGAPPTVHPGTLVSMGTGPAAPPAQPVPSPRTVAMPPPAISTAASSDFNLEAAPAPAPAPGPVAGGDGASSGLGSAGLQDGSKKLVHSLLCGQAHCNQPGCATTKGVLAKMKAHAGQCSYSNLPGGQEDCATCKKWQQLERLKEHYRRKLIALAKSQVPSPPPRPPPCLHCRPTPLSLADALATAPPPPPLPHCHVWAPERCHQVDKGNMTLEQFKKPPQERPRVAIPTVEGEEPPQPAPHSKVGFGPAAIKPPSQPVVPMSDPIGTDDDLPIPLPPLRAVGPGKPESTPPTHVEADSSRPNPPERAGPKPARVGGLPAGGTAGRGVAKPSSTAGREEKLFRNFFEDEKTEGDEDDENALVRLGGSPTSDAERSPAVVDARACLAIMRL